MDKVDYEAKLAIETQKLRDFQAALAQEHEQIKDEAHDGAPLLDAEKVQSNVEQKMLKEADSAADVVIEVLHHGDKDTTRLAAAKYVLENVKGKTPPGDDPWDKILAGITKEQEPVE